MRFSLGNLTDSLIQNTKRDKVGGQSSTLWLIPLQISDNLGILYEVREKSMVQWLKADSGGNPPGLTATWQEGIFKHLD